MERILVATDGSEDAERAIRFAAEMAKQYGAELIIANVIGGFDFPGEMFQQLSAPQSAWIEETLSAESGAVLRRAREIAQDAGVASIDLESGRGSPAQIVLGIADERDVSVVVVGKRGQTRLQGLFLGSVSQKLASLARRPVIIVP